MKFLTDIERSADQRLRRGLQIRDVSKLNDFDMLFPARLPAFASQQGAVISGKNLIGSHL